ncbi:hypothetical protein H0H93_010929, partial [Arthromyces matolae]
LLEMEHSLPDARRFLESWAVGDEIPTELPAWIETFDVRDWDAMLLKYVIPKLEATLRDDLRIDPRHQNMQPLEQVLKWADIIRPSTFSHFLETEFFPKWLDILFIWLIQPGVSFEEVTQWYSFWKDTFKESVQALPGIDRGFTRGLELMNKAIELGPDAPTHLERIDFRAGMQIGSSSEAGR